ncbi:hypothetical protein J3A78_001145 [Streptomyces sp. PvR006]|nr:hypothetical protein [Streptomyces sp. PvR006]
MRDAVRGPAGVSIVNAIRSGMRTPCVLKLLDVLSGRITDQ